MNTFTPPEITKAFNIIEKFGVKERILTSDTKLSDLLVLNLSYKNASFYIVDENGRYIATINHRSLTQNNTANLLNPDTYLGEICESHGYSLSLSLEGGEDNYLPPAIHTFFHDNILEFECPLIDNDGKLVGIINKLYFYTSLAPFELTKEDKFLKYNFDYILFPNTAGLNLYKRNVFSQWGEDGIFEHIFKTIGFTSKYCVEFGGADGIFMSNIRNIIVNHGGRGIFIEGDPEKAKMGIETYKDNPDITFVCDYVGFETNTKLDDILDANNAPDEIDLCSIDIDGYDYFVWEAFVKYRPRVIIIEYNPSIPNEVLFIQPKSENVFQGSSAAAMVYLGVQKGYELVAVTETNCIFVQKEYFNSFGIHDNSLNALRNEDSLNNGKFFQMYNKTLYYSAICRNFIWDVDTKFASDKLHLISFQSKP
jgi:hypothetical protein